MSVGMWVRASSRRKRLLAIVAVFLVSLIVTIIGTLTPISKQDADSITNDFNQSITVISEQGSMTFTSYIFGNNLLLTLLMFVPVIGPVFGLVIMYSSGTVIGAIAASGGYPPALALVALFITPVGWLEFAVYSTAMAESVWFLRRLFQRRALREFRVMAVFVTICTVALAVGAIIEVALISALG